MSRIAPLMPGGDFYFGQVRHLRRDPLGLFVSAMRDHGEVVRMQFGPMTVHLIADPAGVSHVLKDNHKNYGKGSRGFIKLRDILGNGLLTSEGDFWLRQRRIAQPAFHREKITALGEIMRKLALETAERWEKDHTNGEPFDVAREMMRLTLSIVGWTLLSMNISEEADAVGKALTHILHATNERITKLVELPLSVPTPKNRAYVQARSVLDGVVYRAIEERRKSNESKNDFLSLLMNVKDEETGERMSDTQLRDELMTIVLAGHETTANALSWMFATLSRYPMWQVAVKRELDEVIGPREVQVADAMNLPVMRRVFDETLRLYPPAWSIGRSVTADDEVCGYAIPKGSIVLVCPYVTHRLARVWPNPEGFDPERFLPEVEASRPKFAYFPFGGGPRICIGNNFAIMESQIVLATLLKRFRLDLLPGQTLAADAAITLRPRDGVKVVLSKVS